MAILKNVVQVNNGNTGWTKTNVLNALEETFADLGWNGGSQTNGVVTTAFAPGSTSPFNNGGAQESNWRFCGGAGPNESYIASATKYYEVTASGSSAYLMREFFNPSYIAIDDQFSITRHQLTTGSPLVWSGNTNITISGGNLINNTTYYAIVVDANQIKLATSEANALNGIAIDITNNYNSPSARLTKLNYVSNPNITVYQSDTVYFLNNVSVDHPLYINDTAGAYNVNRILDSNNYNSITYRSMPTRIGGEVTFNTTGWVQGNYYYVCQFHSSMNGTITVLPNTYTSIANFNSFPFWDYTVPASGGKSSLPLRIYRKPNNLSYEKTIAGIEIRSSNTNGWSNNDVFTIPGDQIGGTTPANDITFGVNSATSAQQAAFNAVPSIEVTNLGSGVNMYQKFTNQSKGLVKIVNDSTKTYGTTYYGFSLNPSNDYQLSIQSGPSWEYLNYSSTSSLDTNNGYFGGIQGLDTTSYSVRSLRYSTEYFVLEYASSTTPTAYPLKIITYQAQAPQDNNFAIIQFVQSINGIDNPYSTFFLHKGTNYGNGIWNLNDVWQGGHTSIFSEFSNGEGIAFQTKSAHLRSSQESPNSTISIKREAFYGYFRDGNDSSEGAATMVIRNNLYADNTTNYGYMGVVPYYRNAAFDKNTVSNTSTTGNRNDFQTVYSVNSNANYYKPIKGLPINSHLAPCPYYLPDDFVTIPFVVTPGATAFRVGDTITVSPSEVYEIVMPAYTTNQTTYDGISQNTSKGIVFCARTT